MNKTYIGVLIVAVIVIAAGAYQFGLGQSTGFVSLTENGEANENGEIISGKLPVNVESVYEQTEFEKFAELVSREKLIEESRRPNREEYGVFPEIFEDLPPIPDDFGTMLHLFESGLWKNLNYFTEEYYMQPEFYRARKSFQDVCIRHWTEPSPSMHVLHGWGAYPADMWVDTYRGAEFEVMTFWHVPCGVEQYQGFRMVYYFPPHSQDETEETFNVQAPGDVSTYFKVEIQNPEFILGPTYPKFSVDPPFAKPVRVKVEVMESAQPGTYVIAIDTTAPSQETNDKWFLKYKSAYNPASAGPIALQRPHWRLIVNVN